MNYLKFKPLNYFVLAFVIIFVSLFLSCKSKEDPAPIPNLPPLTFNVAASLSTNGQDVILRWNKSKDPEGDVVTYAVVYKDTLVKNLSDTTYTIKNLPFDTEIKGTVVAKDTKGNKTVSLFTIQTISEYVTIPDENFEKYLITLKIDDVFDGKVLRKNIISITSLNVQSETKSDNNKIKSLVGIESFVSIKKLFCHGNLISNLDLSKSNALTDLNCSSNKLLNLDLSSNINLQLLNCGSNPFTTLNLSKNIELTSLSLGGTNMKNFDISKNINLKYFECATNNFSNIDVSNNVSLTTLICIDNKLSSLDISKNTALTYLDCDINELFNLDISKNVSLRYLSCVNNRLFSLDVSKNVPLTFLYISYNLLQELDIRKNINLGYLDCTDNNIRTICVNNLNQVTQNWEKDPTATYKVCP